MTVNTSDVEGRDVARRHNHPLWARLELDITALSDWKSYICGITLPEVDICGIYIMTNWTLSKYSGQHSNLRVKYRQTLYMRRIKVGLEWQIFIWFWWYLTQLYLVSEACVNTYLRWKSTLFDYLRKWSGCFFSVGILSRHIMESEIGMFSLMFAPQYEYSWFVNV